MDNKKYELIVCGQVTFDDIIMPNARMVDDALGGDGIFMLAGAYMWNQEKLGLITRLGNDVDISVIRDATKGKVDLQGVKQIPDMPNVHEFEIYDRKGNRYFIKERWGGNDSKMAPQGPDDFPADYVGNTRAYSVAAIPFPYGAGFVRALPDDAIVLVDPHFDSVYSDNHDFWVSMFPKITIFSPSEDELIRFFGIPAQPDVADYVPYLKQLAQYGVKICNVKLGPRGALTYDSRSGHLYHVPTVATKVVNTTGCGDCFCGGFISGFLRSDDVFEAAVCGSISSSFCIERFGSLDCYNVTPAQVQERYDQVMKNLDRDKCRIL